MTEWDPVKKATLWNVSQINGFVTEDNMQHLVFLVKSPCATAAIVCVISQWVEIIKVRIGFQNIWTLLMYHFSTYLTAKSNKTGKAFSLIGLYDKFV